MEWPLESSRFIQSIAKDVSIDEVAVKSTALKVIEASKKKQFDLSGWKEHPLNPKVMDENALEWIFVVDTLNFCFWSTEGEKLFCCDYQGQQFTGYWSLCACINRALDEGTPILDAAFLAEMRMEDFEKVFRSCNGTQVPMKEKRFDVLKEAGRVLKEDFGGKVSNLVQLAEGDVEKFLSLLLKHFDSYRDYCTYKGKKVYFLKRAQILIADIWACFEGKGFGEFSNIDKVTMFADYRVPQILCYFKMLKYSPDLLQKMKEESIESGSIEEIEIRGLSILSVEMLREEIDRIGGFKGILNCITLDFYLWDLAKEMKSEMAQIPIHKIKTHFY